MKKGSFAILAVLASAALFAAPKRGRVMFWYDTEDYTCPAADEGTLFHAKLLTEFGFRGNFNLVGFYAQRLNELGRTDVIEALSKHSIGSQTLYHSRHPTICEYTDIADWDEAYRRCLAEEAQSVGMIKAVMKLDRLTNFVPPGTSVTPVAMYVYSDLGIRIYGGGMDVFGDGKIDRLAWYCNMLHVPYHAVPRDNDTLANRNLTVIYTHPNQVVTAQFWDGVNYRGENLCEWRKWKQPMLLTAEQQRGQRQGWRDLMARIKADSRLTVVDCDDLLREMNDRVKITRTDVPRLLKHMKAGLEPVEDPSWCVSDIFQAAVRFLCGEREFLPAKAWGFLEKPVGVTEPVTLARADLVVAAKGIRLDAFMPPQIRVGDRMIGPADFLIAALETLATDAGRVTVGPRDQLGPVAKHLPKLPDFRFPGTWVIYSPDFRDDYLSNRLRWQFWTLRYED